MAKKHPGFVVTSRVSLGGVGVPFLAPPETVMPSPVPGEKCIIHRF